LLGVVLGTGLGIVTVRSVEAGSAIEFPLLGVTLAIGLPVGTGFPAPESRFESGLTMPATTLGTGLTMPATTLGTGLTMPATTLGTGLTMPATTLGTGLTMPATTLGRGSTMPAPTLGSGLTMLATMLGRGSTMLATTLSRGSTMLATTLGRGLTMLAIAVGRGLAMHALLLPPTTPGMPPAALSMAGMTLFTALTTALGMLPTTLPMGFAVGTGAVPPSMLETTPPIGSAVGLGRMPPMTLSIGFPLGTVPPRTLEITSIGFAVGTGSVPPSMLETTPPIGSAVGLGRMPPMPLPAGTPLGIVPPKMLEITPAGSCVGAGSVPPTLKLKLTPIGSTIPVGITPPMTLPIGFPLGTGTEPPPGVGIAPRETLRTGIPMSSTTLATVLSRLPMALATGLPVGNGMLFATVLPPMPTPMLASMLLPTPTPTPTQSGRLMSAGNAEAIKAIEKEETMVTCFILEKQRCDTVTSSKEMMIRRELDSSECLCCSEDDRNGEEQSLYMSEHVLPCSRYVADALLNYLHCFLHLPAVRIVAMPFASFLDLRSSPDYADPHTNCLPVVHLV
jgi:hypothetical protein